MNEINIIPNKSHFKLNEICSMLNIKAYVLRFWESEFPEISPEIGPNGEKLYSKKDIEAISQIKKLLFENKLTIEKTKMELQQSEKAPDKVTMIMENSKSIINNEMLLNTKQKLNEILSLTSQWKKALTQI